MPSTLTKRTLDAWRKGGYLCQVVETYNSHARVKNDLYGFLDVLCVREKEIVGIQVTSQSNLSARVDKILKHKNYIPIKKSGIKILVEGWQKKKEGRRLLWESNIVEL